MLQLSIIVAVACAISFGSGWMVNDWRNGAKIARLESRSAVAESANQQCEADIADVRKGVAEMINAATERTKKAEAAMLSAQGQAEKHTAAATAIRTAPVRQDESECEAVFREQSDYVTLRREEPLSAN